jgi:Rieske Fe-S protein
LIEGRENPWLSLLDAMRANVLASATSLITENLDVAKRFVGDRLRATVAKKLDELASGEGAIVDCGGDKLAAYRDEMGGIHAVSPICTHLGCYVQWNSAERTWDCPCHGSRFDLDGHILQGPAVQELSTKSELMPSQSSSTQAKA